MVTRAKPRYPSVRGLPQCALARMSVARPLEPEIPHQGARPGVRGLGMGHRPSQTNHPVEVVGTPSLQPASSPSAPMLTAASRPSRSTLDGLVGQVLDGEFEVQKPIGTGSHADVYLAKQRSLGNRDVAIKVLSRLYMTLPEMDFRRAGQALQREGQLLGELHSSCFVDVYRAGVLPDGRPYIALEFVQGQTLAEMIAAPERIEIELLIDLMQQWADGLAELHARGWVHRDVTPRNAMVEVTPYGTHRLMTYDFGTASPITGRPDRFRVGWERDRPVGTPSYMSPEQAGGGVVDGRSDQYALAAIVYELLTGQRAVQTDGSSAGAVLQYLRGQGPIPVEPLVGLRPDLSSAACDVVHAALDRTPEKRFDDVESFVRALARALRASPVGASKPSGFLGRFFGGKS